jgi:hypothetical protein
MILTHGANSLGNTDMYIKNCEAFLAMNYDPSIYTEVSYEVEQEQIQTEYYIGGCISAPCKNTRYTGCVFAANSEDDFVCSGSYIRSWSASGWGFNTFYLYSIPNLTYPLKVRLVYKGGGTFELYLNNSLYMTLNNVDVSVWNRSRVFYMGPGYDTTQNKLKIKDLIFKK